MTRPGLKDAQGFEVKSVTLWTTMKNNNKIPDLRAEGDKKKITQPIVFFKDVFLFLFTIICACGQVGAYRGRKRHQILWAEARGAWELPSMSAKSSVLAPWKNKPSDHRVISSATSRYISFSPQISRWSFFYVWYLYTHINQIYFIKTFLENYLQEELNCTIMAMGTFVTW